jgi:ABC-2 type transport system ATP-binding protein
MLSRSAADGRHRARERLRRHQAADDVRRAIGVIPQAMTSDLELSVEENLLIYAKLYGVPREKRQRLIHELLEAVELLQWRTSRSRTSPAACGAASKCARLVHEPRVFFLDEPTTGLDPVSRTRCGRCCSGSRRSAI